jgi:hypothetical protein
MKKLKFKTSKDLKFNPVCVGFKDPTAVIIKGHAIQFCRKCNNFGEKFGIHHQHSRRKVKAVGFTRLHGITSLAIVII